MCNILAEDGEDSGVLRLLLDFYGTEHRFSSRLIGFTKEGENACKLLEGMVKRMVMREWKKHVILVRNIVDYIAGMTDSYARNEYRSFCGGF